MDAVSPFAQMPPTPDLIVARVRADLERLAAGLPVPPAVDPERLADETVRRLWDSRVRVFVPVLALREARERLLAGSGSSAPVAPVDLPGDMTLLAPATAGESLHPMRGAGPWGGALGVAALGWPVGEAVVGRPWLGVGLGGWIGLLAAMWIVQRPRR